jgi:hypothetical protein
MTAYYSTNHDTPEVDLAHALLTGQAPDRGLYMPQPIPPFAEGLLSRARDLSYPELAAAILVPYAEGIFSRDTLLEICHDAYDYAVPLERVTANQHIMRLDQGPTASFKDFAARFMGRALGRLVREREREILILTATSGDTGSAIAHAFLGVEGIRVVVLFPIHEVSGRQRKQMTTLGGNVATLALDSKLRRGATRRRGRWREGGLLRAVGELRRSDGRASGLQDGTSGPPLRGGHQCQRRGPAIHRKGALRKDRAIAQVHLECDERGTSLQSRAGRRSLRRTHGREG